MASTKSRHSGGGVGEAALIPLGSHAGSPPIPIKRPATVFGSRKEAVRVHLESSTVSKVHCVLVRNDWGCYLHDLGSRTRTWVNGKKVVDADLKDGDQIQIGRFQFKYTFTPGDSDERLIAPPIELAVSTLTDPLPLAKRVLVIGRRENADLQIEDKAVSNIHAILFEHNGGYQVRDMSSRTGTWIEGKPVHQEVLPASAKLRIGSATLSYVVALPGAPASDDSIAPALFAGAAVASVAPATLADAPIDEAVTEDARADDVLADDARADDARAEAAPIDIDAPAEQEMSAAELDDLLELDLAEPATSAAPVEPTATSKSPAPEPLELAEPDVDADAELTIDLDADLDLDAAQAGAPSEDGLASLRRDWRSPVKADAAPIELEPVAETPTAPQAEPSITEPSVTEPSVTVPVDEIELDLDLDDATDASRDAKDADPEALALEALEDETPVAGVVVPLETAASEIPAASASEIEAPQVDVAEVEVAEVTPAEVEADEIVATEMAAAEIDVDEPEALDLDLSAISLAAPEATADEAEHAVDELDPEVAAPETVDLAPAVEPTLPEPIPVDTTPAAELPATPDALTLEEATLDLEPVDLELEVVEPAADVAPGGVAESELSDAGDIAPTPEAAAETEAPADPEAALAPEVESEIVETPAEALEPAAEAPEPALAEPALELEPLELDESELEFAELASPEVDPAEVEATEPALAASEPAVESAAIEDEAPAAPESLVVDEIAEAEAVVEEGEPEAAADGAAAIEEIELDLEALVEAPAADDLALEDEEPAAETSELLPPTPAERDEPKLEELKLDELVVGEPELDLSAATFAEPSAADEAEESGEPTPVADLAGIDFSSLALDLSPAADASAPGSEATSGASPAESSESALQDFHDENATARPLINLADSIAGEHSPAALEDDADALGDDDIEVVEETQPSPESALPAPETLGAIEAELELEPEPDPLAELDLELDLESTPPAAEAIDLGDIDEDEPAIEATNGQALVVDEMSVDGAPFNETEVDEAQVNESEAGEVAARTDDEIDAPADAPESPAPARRYGRDPAEFVNDASLEIAEPTGGSLNDLIPSGGPLIGGAFAPMLPSMLAGGSPVVVPGSDSPSTPRNRSTAPDRGSREIESRDTEARDNDSHGPDGEPGNDRRKPLRVGFAGQGAAPASPFATGTEGRTIADVLIGRRATQSIDVFANPSPTPEDLLLEQSDKHKDRPAPAEGQPGSTGADATSSPAPDTLNDLDLSGEEREILELAQQFKPRGSIRSVQNYHQQAPATIPPVYRAGDEPETHAALRRRRIGRVFVCLALMATLIPAALFLVNQRYAPVTKVDAMVTFTGLEGLSADEARQFRVRQNEYLLSETTRQDAVAMLDQAIPKGFLDSTLQIAQSVDRDPDIRWPLNQPALMRLRVASLSDKENDVARVRVLAQALVNANRSNRDKREALQADVSKNKAELEAKIARRDEIKNELTALGQLGDSTLTADQINTLQLNRKAAEDELRAVKSHRQELEAAIDRLQREALAPATAPAAVDVAKADAELTKLNQQLADLQKQSEAVKTAVDEKNIAARKQLDLVIGQFEADLQTAQKLKDNPELAQYVEAVNRHFKLTRQLTEQVLRRQEQQQTRLSELKQRVSERTEARTKELLEKDGELKKLNDTLAFQTRQYNAAIAEGLKEEATKTELQMQLVRSLISGREDLYKNDPIHSDTIRSLQTIIETTEASIVEDRKQVDDALAKAQEDFMRNAPAVEKLPAEQKALAEALDKKLAAVNEARKAHDAIAESAKEEQAKLDASLKEKMATLQLEITARRNDISAAAAEQQAAAADTDRKQRITDTQAQLASVQQLEARTQAKVDATQKSVQDAQSTLQAFRASDTKRNELEGLRDDLDRDIKQINAWLSVRRPEMARLIVPEAKPELQSYDTNDRRPKLMLAAGGGLLGLLLIPLVWNLLLLSRDAHHATAAMPVGGVNGHNGHANGHAHDDADQGTRGPGFDPILPDETDDAVDADELAHAKLAHAKLTDADLDETTPQPPLHQPR